MEQGKIRRNPPSGFIERELPYPIAAAWTKVRACPADAAARRKDVLIECTEVVLRTLVAYGLSDYLRGPRTSRWEPTRRETAQSPSLPARSESRPEPLARR